jgi:hypothetical protein
MDSLKICDICQQPIEEELWFYHRRTEETALKRILEQYPQWADSDRKPSEKCKQYYRLFLISKKH